MVDAAGQPDAAMVFAVNRRRESNSRGSQLPHSASLTRRGPRMDIAYWISRVLMP
jgi:hypothetical protein